MIFVGGSNLSFGLNSQIIKDKLKINPINTGVHADLGMRYMLENTIQYVKEGDIIILAFEYSLFYIGYNDVSEILLRTILDVDPAKVKILNIRQAVRLVPYIPKYLFSKFKPTEYFNVKESDVYSVNSFNCYGDVYTHWGLERRAFQPYDLISGQFNQSVIHHMLVFQKEVTRRKAKLYVTYPGYQDIHTINL